MNAEAERSYAEASLLQTRGGPLSCVCWGDPQGLFGLNSADIPAS